MAFQPPYDDMMKAMTNQWLHRQHHDARDSDHLQIAAWLDGRLGARDSARVEGLLAADPALLAAVLSLREHGAEPVAAGEVLAAQALVRPARMSSWSLRDMLREWRPLPLACGAMVSALAVVCSVWLGGVVAWEFGAESVQTASLLEITQLDFGASNSIASVVE